MTNNPGKTGESNIQDKKKRFVLRFVSGKYQGGEIPVPENKEIIVGRSSNIDIVLVEDMVSRQHAKIFREDNQLIIQDLESTNGTFVNGERVKKRVLLEGDRILIGTSIIKLVSIPVEDLSNTTTEASLKNISNLFQQTRTTHSPLQTAELKQVKGMAGSLTEIPLPDLLQLFSNNKKTGVLILKKEEKEGSIYLKEGKLCHAVYNNQKDLSPMKVIFRLLGWTEGTFEFLRYNPNADEFANTIEESVEMMLMEGMRQLDEIKRLQEKLPHPDALINIARPMNNKLRDLPPEELDMIQLVHNYREWQTIIDYSPLNDLDTILVLLKLLESKYIQIE